MNRLALAFGIVCLLQGLSASPRPQYGLSVNVRNSAKITAVGNAVANIQSDITGITFATLSAGYLPYDITLDVIEDLASDVGSIISPILSAYSALLGDTSGNVASAFGPFLATIDSANAYLTGSAIGGYLSTLSGLGYTGITDQLNDEGERLAAGLTALKSAAQTVEADLISAAASIASNNLPLTTSALDGYLKLSDMYALLTAASNLEAYLPLLTYILTTVNNHLQEGDDYINSLQSAVESSTTSAASEYISELSGVINEIETAVTSGFRGIYNSYGDIAASFGGLSGLTSATDYGSLGSTISAFFFAFLPNSVISTLDGALASSFAELEFGLTSYIDDSLSSVSVVDNDLVDELVDVLIGNLEYGDYCYNKYKYLVDNLLTQGLDGGFECVDKEYIRLEHLKETLLLILDLVAIDQDDIYSELTVCNQLTSKPAALNGCVTELSGYYSALLTATKAKRDLLYQLAEGEADASLNRLLICLELVYIDTSVTQSDNLYSGLQICAKNGPNGSD